MIPKLYKGRYVQETVGALYYARNIHRSNTKNSSKQKKT